MRPLSVYRCQACGFQAGKWYGRCPDCGEFNTIVEERTGPAAPRGGAFGRRAPATRGAAPTTAPVPLAAVSAEGAARVQSGVAELDRVLGGGVVPGSLVLIGGDPGIGKSTLLLQASAALARAAGPVLYVSGEESAAQVKLRAARLLWAGLMQQFNPSKAKSSALRTHCQTSGWSLSAQDVNNNVVLGTGQIDWPSVLKEAKKQGIKYYFIEDESASAAEQIPQTLKYLEQVKW